MAILYLMANEIAIASFLVIVIFKDKFMPERVLGAMLSRMFIGLFILAQVITLFYNLTLIIWPAKPIGHPELLIRGLVIFFIVLYHVRKAIDALIEIRIYGIEPMSPERLIYNLYIFSAVIFGFMPLMAPTLLRMPATYFYLSIIFLKLLLFPELYSKFYHLRLPNLRKVISVVYVILLLTSIFTLFTFMNYFQASDFNDDIITTSDPPFVNEVPSHLVRLVDENLARSTMLRYISEFGSNAILGRPHISLNGSDLIWIAPVYPNNLWAENYIKGFIIVHANDPLTPPTIITEKFYIGNNLLGGEDAQITNYLLDTNLVDSLAYFVVHPTDGIKLVLTRVRVSPLLYQVPYDIIVYNNDGSIYATYTWSNAPSWIPQLVDEDLLETIITNWGSFKRGDSVDLFASGFLWIPTSPDRVEITEDTRYIINPDDNRVEAFIHVHPIGNDRTLAGIIKVNNSGIYFHDFKQLGLISGRVAHDIAESNLPRPATGYYFATMGMLYPVKHPTSGETVWTWYVPIYWEKEGTTVFAGLALINARDISYFAFDTIGEDEHGPDFVNRVLNMYRSILAGKELTLEELELNATVLEKYEYVYNGETHIVLGLDNDTVRYAEASPSDVNASIWYLLLSIQIGDYVWLKVHKDGDKWVIVDIRKLS